MAAANTAGQKLGIPSVYILAQWGMESGWGTQPNMGQNNPGNVGNLGNGNWQNYSSQSSFVNAYVAAMENDFPYFSHPVAHPTVADIFSGPNKYDPSNPNYNNNVAGALTTMMGISSVDSYVSNNGGTNLGSQITGAAGAAGSAVGTAAGDVFGFITGTVGKILWAVVALILFLVGIVLLLNADPADALKLANPVTAVGAVADKVS